MTEKESATATLRSPLGAVGSTTDRDPTTGRFVSGNRAAVVVGARSMAFWQEHEQARREITEAVLTDRGHSESDAPRALALAADGIAQATLIRDAAYGRLVEAGGPLTSSGRVRRAFTVWLNATDRLERHLRLVSLQRLPKPGPSLAEYLAGGAGPGRGADIGVAKSDSRDCQPGASVTMHRASSNPSTQTP